MVGTKRNRSPETDQKLLQYADLAKRRCKDLIGDEGLKHLSKPAQQVVLSMFELSHGDKDYYKKTAGIFLRANEAVC